MKILILNSGSSSLKFKVFENNKKLELVAEGMIDGLGLKTCRFTFKSENKNIGQSAQIKTHKQAIDLTLKTLLKAGVIKNNKEISAIGHRVVHGGEYYSEPTKIDARVIKRLNQLSELAPLHNPANIKGIEVCKKLLARTPQIAVFDTAFHQTMEEKAYIYGIPYNFYKKHNIRRYGFHGTSHKYVTNEALKIIKKKKVKTISCHIGNGVSITAELDGKSIDTSMGFTPLEGVMMGTRCGSIDPAIIFHLVQEKKMKLEKVEELLINDSGLEGLSEVSSDMRLVWDAAKKKDKLAQLSIEIFSYQIAKYVGAYVAVLNGLDGLIFTGGIGEKAEYVREKICQHFEYIGLKLDKRKNENSELILSTPKSKVKVMAIPTDEEMQIAMETQEVL
ncbi:acetate/propionate family kinase [Patescibacteria group bacterium]